MKNLTLDIYDTQRVYADRLADYISRMPDSPFIVKVHVDAAAEPAVSTVPGICLITSSLWEKCRRVRERSDAVMLDETGKSREEGVPIIYKYQSAADIYRVLLDYCMENDLRPAVSVRGMRRSYELWLIYVPCGSRRRSEEVLELCRMQSEKTRTLYINAEMVTNFTALTAPSAHEAQEIHDEPEEAGLSELIYYMKQYKGSVGMRVDMIARRAGELHYIPPAANGREIPEISGEEWSMLNAGIRDETEYGTAVIDFGPNVPPAQLLEQCSRIIAVSGRSTWEMQLIEKYRQMIQETAGSEAAEKIEMRGDAD